MLYLPHLYIFSGKLFCIRDSSEGQRHVPSTNMCLWHWQVVSEGTYIACPLKTTGFAINSLLEPSYIHKFLRDLKSL